MLVMLILWILIFTGLSVLGFSVVRALRIITGIRNIEELPGLDQYFFFGFLSVAAITGILSVFISMGVEVLYSG